ncbi:MAG: TraR/DksA C4-type zinc finger protein [Candidatus Sulfotelmatobacter sp.]
MTKREFKELKERLEKQLHEVQGFLGRLGQETRELELDVPQDSADRSVASLSQETLFEQASQRRQQLRRIEGALRRMDEGSFGTCQVCEREIARRRLEALPWTQHCLECQKMIEQETLQPTSAAS